MNSVVILISSCHSVVLTHGHAWQSHANLCMLFIECLNTDFVVTTNTINLYLMLSTIYIFIPVSGGVGRGPSTRLCSGGYNAVKTTLSQGRSKA